MKLTTPIKTQFSFASKVREIKKSETTNVSTASIEQLSRYVPQWVDLYKNKDILGVAFDAAVVNLANLNGDCIDSRSTLNCLDSFRNKPINIEHERSEIVGHIVDAAMSEREFHKRLGWDDVSSTTKPFYITLSGIIYKALNKELSKALCEMEDDDEEVISASWEISFDEYCAAVGSDILEECEIITKDEDVEKLSKYMKGFGGNGKTPEGKIVNRLICGSPLALGVGLTMNPAADVKGVYAWNIEASYPQKVALRDIADKKIEKSENKISQNLKSNVSTFEQGNNMTKEELLSTFKEALASVSKPESAEAVANVAKTLADQIVKANEKFVQEKVDAEQKAKDAQAAVDAEKAKIADLENKVKASDENLKKVSDSLKVLEDEKAQAVAKKTFDERMAIVDAAYELTDDDRKMISEDVKALASDEDFAKLQEKYKVLLAAKNKEAIAKQKEELEKAKKEAVAAELEKRGIKDPLESKEEEKISTANNSAAGSDGKDGLKEKLARWSEAFSKEKVSVKV